MKKKCTAGVYVLVGTRGVRVGQSKCLERRIPEARKAYGRCIGRIVRVLKRVEPDKSRRLRIERRLIDQYGPRCNPVRR